MPVRVYLEEEILRIDYSGEITEEDIAAGLVAVDEIEERVRPVPPRICDLSSITGTGPRFQQLLGLVARRKAKSFPNAFKSALVAPRPVLVGIARMFQTMNDHPQITVQIFPDHAAAKAWLAEKS